jgi:hypothetical protein
MDMTAARPARRYQCLWQGRFRSFQVDCEPAQFPARYPFGGDRDWTGDADAVASRFLLADRRGTVVGIHFLDERGPIAAVDPLTVDPAMQYQHRPPADGWWRSSALITTIAPGGH